jgi:hypothetical protein
MTSGDLVHVFCRAGQVGAAFTVADTLGNTFGAGSLNSFSDGADQGFWIINSLAGSDTITCSANGSVAFLGMQVDQFHPGFLTVPDSSANLVGNVAGPTGTVTSPAFSTTAKGLVFFCGDPAFASGGINGGLIAGLTGIIPSADVSAAQQCQFVISTSSLSGTASMSAATGTGNWGFVLDAFK